MAIRPAGANTQSWGSAVASGANNAKQERERYMASLDPRALQASGVTQAQAMADYDAGMARRSPQQSAMAQQFGAGSWNGGVSQAFGMQASPSSGQSYGTQIPSSGAQSGGFARASSAPSVANNAPTAGTPAYGAPPVRSTTPPSWMGTDQNWWTNEKNQNAIGTWGNLALPIWQLEQNQRQYQGDFNEAQRQYNNNYALQSQGQQWNQNFQQSQADIQNNQWDRNFTETQGQNRFNNQLASDQFAQTQWRDTQNQNNWNAEFGQTQLRDNRQQQNWQQEFGANRADTAWNQGFQNQSLAQQAQLSREQNEANLQASRYAAFGRNRAPATGWANYG